MWGNIVGGTDYITLSTKIVNMIQTEPFKLGTWNLVHILFMIIKRTKFIDFQGQGQMSRFYEIMRF